MKILLLLMIIYLTFFIMFLNHPLSMGLSILIQTLLTCLFSSMLIFSSWFSYVLFLIFLGGLLVLFIYISSLASNEMFYLNFNYFLMFNFFFFLMIIMIMLNFNNLIWMNLSFNNEMINFFNNYFYLFFNNENKINLTKLYNEQTFIFMMMMIIYLFMTLIAIVKITNIFYGPLRSHMNK